MVLSPCRRRLQHFPGLLRMFIVIVSCLLLIGWTASFTYISMERFWTNGKSDLRA